MNHNTKTGLWLILATAMILPTAAALQDVDLEQSRESLRALVNQNAEYYRLKSKWALEEEILVDRIDLKELEIENLTAKAEEARGKVDQAATELGELREANDRLNEITSRLEDNILHLEASARALVLRLPVPLADDLKPLTQRLPQEGEEVESALTERYQAVIAIFNGAGKFNREVHVSPEVHELSDGTSAEVTVLYFGLAKAYYVSPSGEFAGIGTPTEGGWVWTPADEHAEAIQLAVDVKKNAEPAEFVPLPFGQTLKETE